MDNTTPIIVSAFPTPKEQVTSHIIAIGLTAATFAVIGAGFWVYGKSAAMINKRSAQKNNHATK